ncbi:MAG: NAD(P)-binding domain-containing protein [Methanomassiliicoccales archaeon]|nr:NAD(P)-binding domain-containing protein [Methanomassiliicoccales archaeon]
MKVVFTELTEHADFIRTTFPDDELVVFDRPLDEQQLVEASRDAEIISVFIYTQVTKAVIDSLPNLKLIVTRSVGFDHVAARYAIEKGVIVCHVPDYGAHVVAEHVFALLLACARKIPSADAFVKNEKKFDFSRFLGLELMDKTLGVVGTGKIGAAVIDIAEGFGMKIVAYDVYQNKSLATKYGFPYLSLDEVLEKSDFVTLHTPLTPETHHLIDARAISKMKKGSILVNASRGGVLDSVALKEALESGHLWGAGIDVLEDEAHPEANPLLDAPNLIITPHSAFYTKEVLSRITELTIETIRSFKEGKPTNRVPSEYL